MTDFVSVILSLCILLKSVYCGDDSAATSILPASCVGLSDGNYYLKLMDDDNFPIIYAQCSNEYIILNPSLDSEVVSYFLSFQMYHHSVAGPSNEHIVNWEEWFIPHGEAKDNNFDLSFQYLISPDCTLCEVDHERQLYGTHTVYTMTGTMFGCFWILLGEHDFDQDYDTYQCYYTSLYGSTDNNDGNADNINEVGDLQKYPLTDESSITDWDLSGVCAFNVRAANIYIPFSDHDACTVDYTKSMGSVEYGYHLKPSLGTDGNHCICAQPSDLGGKRISDDITVLTDDLILKQTIINDKLSKLEVENPLHPDDAADIIQQFKINFDSDPPLQIIPDDDADDITVYLSQSDFEFGTYRITKPGIYILNEDINFNPNSIPDDGEVNSNLGAWWPHGEQVDEYPGAGGYHDPYFMGFWAAITIETHDVVLDLNGKTIKMEEIFYYQQRWFTVIGLATQYFLPGQGIGLFGADPDFAENVIIQNGIIGLTSHHCIHGNFNKNILIEDVQCRDFETHGFQFNGFDNIIINNVEIGPSSSIAYLRGDYGHARALLPRLQKVADENPDQYINFDGRDEDYYMIDIVDELLRQINAIYNYVVYNKIPDYVDEDDEDSVNDWNEILNLFYNPSGIPNGASMHGIFLNTNGASVLTYNLVTEQYSNNAKLSNIKIHDLVHKMDEYSRISTPGSGSIFMNPFHAPFDGDQLFKTLNKDYLGNQPRYKGSIMTDASFALSDMSDNWNLLQAGLIWKDRILPWVKGDDITSLGDIVLGCNHDAMIHSGKGVIGIRLDGVKNVDLDSIDIYSLSDETDLGRLDCGEYSKFDRESIPLGGGHMRQKAPMQIGFSGNNLQGISINAADQVNIRDINIHDLYSFNGDSFGISIWPSVNLIIDGSININNIIAGHQLMNDYDILSNVMSFDSRPNRAPSACGIFKIDQYFSKENQVTYYSNVDYRNIDENNVKVSNLNGFVGCQGNEIYTNIGEYTEEEEEEEEVAIGVDEEEEEEEDINTDSILNDDKDPNEKRDGIIVATSIAVFGLLLMGCVLYIYCKHRRRQMDSEAFMELYNTKNIKTDEKTPLIIHNNGEMKKMIL